MSPRVFLINARKLAETKQRIHDGDKTFNASLQKLEDDARKAPEPGAVIGGSASNHSTERR